MRIIHIITRLIVGGAQENTIATVLGLREQFGMDVRLFSGPTTGPEGTLEPWVSRIHGLLTTVPSLVRPIHPWKDVRALCDLTRLIRAEEPAIVHTHSGKAGIIGRLAAKHASVPIVVHTIHGPSFGSFQGHLANLVFKSAERLTGKQTTHFVSVSQAMTDQYLAAGIGSPERFSKIFSGFALDPFLNSAPNPELRRRFGIRPDDIVVGKVARLFKLKGHEDLISIAAPLVKACPRIKFLLVGGGEWEERFKSTVRDQGLQNNFVFTGLVPPHEIPALLGIVDIVVHLSTREGLARVLPQAMAAGKPIVAYDCDGAAEVCMEDRSGFLVRPGDLEMLKHRLLELAVDPNLRRRLGMFGRDWVPSRFSESRMVDEIAALYSRLTAAAGIGRAADATEVSAL